VKKINNVFEVNMYMHGFINVELPGKILYDKYL